MSWGFELGRVYNRRADIHGRFGGQQQGGIITPGQHPVVIIITGEEGLQHGYADRYRADGAFEYFGEGQVGDMQIRAGNRAIAEHSEQGKGLLLFRKTDDGLRFEGEMVYEGRHVERAPDRTGAERDAIVFELRALEAVAEKVEAEPALPGATLAITGRAKRVSAEPRCSQLRLGPSQRQMRGVHHGSAIYARRRHALS
jgi:5-methylcytosine-specific restriction enzyme A